MGAYMELLAREAVRKKNGGWLLGSELRGPLSASSSGSCGMMRG